MEINSANARDFQVIESYGPGGFRVSGQRFSGAILVLPRRTIDWPVAGLSAVDAACLGEIAAEQPEIEVFLLGCGDRAGLLTAAQRRDLRDSLGLSVDVMDTGAACRTYSVLLAEGRPVAAGLFPVTEMGINRHR